MENLGETVVALTRQFDEIFTRPHTRETKAAKVREWLRTSRAVTDALRQGARAELRPGVHEPYTVYTLARDACKALLTSLPPLMPDVRLEVEQFLQEIPQYVDGTKYKFSNEWFSGEIEQQWREDLGGLAGRPGLRFLEIGSYEGRSTCWLLENVLTHPSSRILCIDVAFQPVFQSNIRQTGAAEKVEALSGPSYSFLRALPVSQYDFIYVDGSHLKRDVIEDAVLAWRLLKPGGLVTFDDYRMTDCGFSAEWYGDKGPEVAIDCFLNCYAGEYRIVHKGYQITIEKLSPA
jgi:hypothetical protein